MSSASAAVPQKQWWQSFYGGLQKMGRSLQLPVAVLPAAGILNRLGQPDIFGPDGKIANWPDVAKVLAGAGGALLDSSLGLPLLFCIGVAIGMAKKADGSTALAAVAGFLVYYNILHQFPVKPPTTPTSYQNPGVFGGIIMGLMASWFWVRFHRTKLVDWLGFFNGRRLVPMIMAFVGLVFAVLCLWIWPPIGTALTHFSKWLSDLGSVGSGIFGVANRALLVIGMHQFLNTFMWFQYGSFTKPNGTVVNGDINRFLAATRPPGSSPRASSRS